MFVSGVWIYASVMVILAGFTLLLGVTVGRLLVRLYGSVMIGN